MIYVSRTLTPAEERYSNIERELLGVVFAMERLHNYVFGEPVRVQTDHKPLEMIWKKSIATASPRLQRLLLRLARYEIQVEYICGKDNSIADALSLHAGHLGEEKTLLRARETVSWPRISDDVRNAVKLCDVCTKYKPAQQKEPQEPHDVPSLPWFRHI